MKSVQTMINDAFPYTGYNPHQYDAIEFVVNTFLEGKKFAILEAPTGSGKSAIGYTVGETMRSLLPVDHYGPYTIALTRTLYLQKQYARDFDYMKTLWSATHYPCALLPEDREAYYGGYQCKGEQCSRYEDCEYVKQKDIFNRSPIGVLNYSYFSRAKRYNPQIMICDECHNLEDIICENAQVTISKSTATRFRDIIFNNNINQPDKLDWDMLFRLTDGLIKLDPATDWTPTAKILATELHKTYNMMASFYERQTENLKMIIHDMEYTRDNPSLQRLKYLNRIATYCRTSCDELATFISSESPWIIQTPSQVSTQPPSDSPAETQAVTYKPLYAAEFSQKFFNRAKFVLLMSATICGADYLASDLGLLRDDYASLSLPSNFAPGIRPVMAIPMAGLNNRNLEELLPGYVEMIDHLIEDQLGDNRGIIHSVSYANAEFVLKHSKFKDRMILPKTEDLQDLIEILESRTDTILVSPAITEGVDLRGNLSRFNIILKVPFLYLGDPWVSEKMKKDRVWYIRNAVVDIVQGSGRSTRDERDWSITFILDGNFRRIFTEQRALFPSWWTESVSFIDM